MRQLEHVAFLSPIPIPGTHRRATSFSAIDGWTLWDDEGKVVITDSSGMTFYTYVSACCVPVAAPPAPETVPDVAKRRGRK